MDFNQFVDEVKGGIKQFLPIEYEDAQVRIEEIKKLNENYLGITVLKENQVIAPTFNPVSYTHLDVYKRQRRTE